MKESTSKILLLLASISSISTEAIEEAKSSVTELDSDLDAAIAARGEALNGVARQRSENEAEAARLEQLKRDLESGSSETVQELTEKVAGLEGLVSELSEANAALQAEVAALRREAAAKEEEQVALHNTPDDVPLGVSVPGPVSSIAPTPFARPDDDDGHGPVGDSGQPGPGDPADSVTS